MIGEAAGAAMSATPYGMAANAAMSAIESGQKGPSSAATSGDATQNAAFKAAFGDTFGAFNFSPSNAIGQKATAQGGGLSLPVILGAVGVALSLVIILNRQKG